MYELDVDDDVNRVLFALSEPLQTQTLEAPLAKGSKKSIQKGKTTKNAEPIKIHGSAAAVKLLTPRLHDVVQQIRPDTLSEFEAMLQSLSLTK